jgi:flagellar basal-body rod protein FlgG
MFRALYTAASGMTAQQLNLDNISNNLANSSTTGFQQRRLQFSDLLYQNEIMPGSAATQQTTVAAGLQIGLGTRPGATEVIQTQGDFTTTGNPLDSRFCCQTDRRDIHARDPSILMHRERWLRQMGTRCSRQ